jgi:hypothetical protein
MKNKAIYPCSLKCSQMWLIGRRGDEITMSKKVIPSNSHVKKNKFKKNGRKFYLNTPGAAIYSFAP